MKISPLAAIIAASSLVSAQAADVTWTLNGTGAFTNGANWSDLAVPDNLDDAIINNGGTATIGSSDVVAVSRLVINNGTVTQNGGETSTVPFGDFNSPGAYVIGGVADQTGTYNVDGAAFLSGGRFRIGADGGTGSVTLSGTSSYFAGTSQDTWVGGPGSTGSLTLNNGATWNVTSDWITVGNSGQGTLTLNNESQLNVSGGQAVLGAGAGTATVALSGTSSINNATGEVWIGNDGGTATVDIAGSSVVTTQTNWIAVGRNGGTGTVTIRDQGTLSKLGTNTAQNLTIGSAGSGTVNLQDSGTLSSQSRILVGERGGVGNLNVTSGTVTSTDDFVVGQDGGSVGTLEASGGTFTVGGWTKMGYLAGSSGSMTVSGTTQISTGGSLVVGDSGSGILTVNGGTLNTTGQTWIGQGGTASGEFNLAGGSYTTGSWVAVGRDGSQGALNVSGGTFTNTSTGAVAGAGLSGANFVVLGSAEKVALVNHTGGTINNLTSAMLIGETGTAVAEWTATGGTANFGDTRVGFSGRGTMTIGGTANYTASSVYLGSNVGSVGTLNLEGNSTFAANFIEEGAGDGFLNLNGSIVKALQDVTNYFRDFEAGDVTIGANGLKFDTNGKTVGIEHALEGVGGLTKLGAGTLILSGANTYQGNTLVSAGILRSNTTASFGDFSSINILTGSTLDLNFLGTDSIGVLYFNGIAQLGGVWGAIGSGSQYESSFITGTGTLTTTQAIPEPSTVALLIGGVALVGLRLRSRARAAHQA